MKTTTTLAVASLKHNKSRSILTAGAIFLTTCLLTIIALIGNGMLQFEKQNAGRINGEYFARYFNVDKTTVDSLRQDPRVVSVGLMQNLANISGLSTDVGLAYFDQTALELNHFTIAEGALPEKENEIAGTREMFAFLGIPNPELSDRVSVSYRKSLQDPIQTEEFIISGFLTSDTGVDLSSMHLALVSKQWVSANLPELSYTVLVKTLTNDLDGTKLNSATIEIFLKELAADYSIPEEAVDSNLGLLIWLLEPGIEILSACILLGLLIILFSIIVIYNIFYVGIVQKVQEYGKLRAIGTTKRQLKQILRTEGMVLCILGIPAGLLTGSVSSRLIFSYIIQQGEILERGADNEITFISPVLLLISALLSMATVFLGLHKPMKKAVKIAPVEAMRYQEQSMAKEQRNGYQNLNLFHLTMANLSRNKKRTWMTILTMGLSCVLFVTVANIGGNMDPEWEVRQRYVSKGDFLISLNTGLNDPVYPENNLNRVQQLGLFDEAFVNKVYAILGVTAVERQNVLAAKHRNPAEGDMDYVSIVVLDPAGFEQLADSLDAGTADYGETAKQGGVIYLWSDYWMKEFGYEIGDTMEFELQIGDRVVRLDAPLTGCVSAATETYAMTEETFRSLGITEDTTSKLYISCEKEKEEQVYKQLSQLIAGGNFYRLVSYKESLELMEMQMGMLRTGAYALLFILGLIGFMNLANTLITSIITRKREFGILQAIGMTTKQLQWMLSLEGLLFTAGTLFIALTAGNVFGYLAFCYMKEEGVIGVFQYSLPAEELIGMIVLVAALQLLLSYRMSRTLQKDSLTDRIRYQE